MIVVVMGVAGSGKSTVGEALARELGWAFLDGDSLHAPESIAKMSKGIPLDDADRAPWLARLAEVIARWKRERQNGVVACSALKESYRRALGVDGESVRLIFLDADPAVLRARLEARRGHFAGAALLDSQLATLERPVNATWINVDSPINVIVREARAGLGV